jgi:hypothetical protein
MMPRGMIIFGAVVFVACISLVYCGISDTRADTSNMYMSVPQKQLLEQEKKQTKLAEKQLVELKKITKALEKITKELRKN